MNPWIENQVRIVAVEVGLDQIMQRFRKSILFKRKYYTHFISYNLNFWHLYQHHKSLNLSYYDFGFWKQISYWYIGQKLRLISKTYTCVPKNRRRELVIASFLTLGRFHLKMPYFLIGSSVIHKLFFCNLTFKVAFKILN